MIPPTSATEVASAQARSRASRPPRRGRAARPPPARRCRPPRDAPPMRSAGRDDVGEAQAGPAQHRGAGARAHDEQAELLGGVLLELDLGGDGDVVAEQQDVRPARSAPCASRGRRGRPGTEIDGDVPPAGARAPRPACGPVPRPPGRPPVSATPARQNARRRPATAAASTASSRRRPHREHEVAGARPRPAAPSKPSSLERSRLAGVAIDRGRPVDALDGAHRPGRRELQHGVDVRVGMAPDAARRGLRRVITGGRLPDGQDPRPRSLVGGHGDDEMVASGAVGRGDHRRRPPCLMKRAAAATFGPHAAGGELAVLQVLAPPRRRSCPRAPAAAASRSRVAAAGHR